ncbi:hypothetical protein [Cryobacterium zhongshanensis]|uniref:Uncharacterized protein n=1 Tax=Cryobacterium zhongshanensis TaxID=2928153 RepID=A0AA41UED0_9MICO|nr:hypothetical protein [Cryobacterium zhongshanensis]MCI4657323.1 hypothetical protein [Cryobacterium zhongshanensis]
MDEEEWAVRLLDAALCPFYDSAGLQAWRAHTSEALLNLVKDARIVAVSTLNGDFFFPTFQFSARGELLPIREVPAPFSPSRDCEWLRFERSQSCPQSQTQIRRGGASLPGSRLFLHLYRPAHEHVSDGQAIAAQDA